MGWAVVPRAAGRYARSTTTASPWPGAVLGLVAEAGEETVVPADDIATSFPTFAETLRTLGASL